MPATGLNYEQRHLVKMANQIATNVPNRNVIAEQVATHMHSFWTPEMLQDLEAIDRDYPDELVPEVHVALQILRRS